MNNGNFFAMLSRMRYIERWALMYSSRRENLSEHTFDVIYLCHALAEISDKIFEKPVNIEKTLLTALYHDSSEILTGDLPSPIKYQNPEIQAAYNKVEISAVQKLVDMLPAELKPAYTKYMLPQKTDEEYKIVKAADRLSALIKCISERTQGNREFKDAEKTILREIEEMNFPPLNYFCKHYISAYELSLDDLS